MAYYIKLPFGDYESAKTAYDRIESIGYRGEIKDAVQEKSVQ